jgi:hypothetical protein
LGGNQRPNLLQPKRYRDAKMMPVLALTLKRRKTPKTELCGARDWFSLTGMS